MSAAAATLRTLALKVELLDRPDRDTDAEVAVAMFDHSPGCLSQFARLVVISHGAKPGDYEVCSRSGVSLHTAPEYTATEDGRRQTAVGLRLMAAAEQEKAA